jgi:hypothetical protein
MDSLGYSSQGPASYMSGTANVLLIHGVPVPCRFILPAFVFKIIFAETYYFECVSGRRTDRIPSLTSILF